MQRSTSLVAPLAMSLLLAGCGGSDDNSTTTSITIPFAAKAGNTDINCDATLPELGNSADNGMVSNFAFYIHDIMLKTQDGSSHAVTLESNDFQDATNGVALLDFQDKGDSCQGAAKPTNKMVYLNVDDVDTSDITGVEFKVGIPAEINHHNASASGAPYNRSDLAWSWQSGHKFMRMDINPEQKVQVSYDYADGANESNTYFFHLGSTGCEGDPITGETTTCAYENRPQISVDENFSVTGMTSSTVVFDYAKLVEGVDINTDTVIPPGCMSGVNDAECTNIFSNLGMDHGDTPATGLQTVFSASN